MVPDTEDDLRAYYADLVAQNLATWEDAVNTAEAKGFPDLATEFAGQAHEAAAAAAPDKATAKPPRQRTASASN